MQIIEVEVHFMKVMTRLRQVERKEVTHHVVIRFREVATHGERAGRAGPVGPASAGREGRERPPVREGERESFLH